MAKLRLIETELEDSAFHKAQRSEGHATDALGLSIQYPLRHCR